MDFDDWLYEQISIDAAESVGPNSVEYDALCERLAENERYVEIMRVHYALDHATLTPA